MDPTQELQEEIIVALLASAPVNALVARRIYDLPPAGATAPYVSMGPASATQDDAECIETQEVTLQLDVWSDLRGYQQCRRIADAVRRALRNIELPFQHNALVTFEHRITRFMRDSNGIGSHAAMTFTAFIEVPE